MLLSGTALYELLDQLINLKPAHRAEVNHSLLYARIEPAKSVNDKTIQHMLQHILSGWKVNWHCFAQAHSC